MKLIALFFLILSSTVHAKTICTMTFNSDDERKAMQTFYKGTNTHLQELVPVNREGNWFEKACNSGVQCDELLVSGHFGGLFFGNVGAQTLDLKKLEQMSCQNQCGNILNAKKVYLMGCNTLATKTPDNRSIDQYIKILIQDGFPRQRAEEVAASRYAEYGLSLGERMSIAFKNSETIYGFNGTSPLGEKAGPMLLSALRASTASNLTEKLASSFQGTSFRTVRPSIEVPAEPLALSCQLRSPNEETRFQGFKSVFAKKSLLPYFDEIISHADDSALLRAFQHSSKDLIFNILATGQHIISKINILIGTHANIYKLENRLGALHDADYFQNLYKMISSRLRNDLDYVSIDQICQIGREDPTLIFQNSWMNSAKPSNLAYFARLSHCFSSIEAKALAAIKNLAKTSSNSFVRREALRSLVSKLDTSEKQEIFKLSKSWPETDQIEASFATGLRTPIAPVPYWSNCAVHGYEASDRDLTRWSCFNDAELLFPNMTACLAAANQFETRSGAGAFTFCFEHFKKVISLSSCKQIASRFQDDGEYDNSILDCWTKVRFTSLVNRSECLGFMEALKLPGDQIKQNWNCVHEVSR